MDAPYGGPVTPRCPECDDLLHTWRGQVEGDPSDVEPHAECSSPTCDYLY